MLSKESMYGGPGRKHECQFLTFGFTNTLKNDYRSQLEREKDNLQHTELFECLDAANIVFTDATTTSNAVLKVIL